ncbi:MAG: YbbR-like domain-containing protein [Candidatus Aminicenantes bacterium]|nr:YbbR-like domain-containing protein [Candidatus Aminicenantes bacterium]
MKRFRRWLVKNWGLKLLAVALALIVWLSLIPEERTFSEKTLTVPLETHNLPADLEIVERPPAAIDLTVRAPRRLIDQITPSNVFAKLNLTNATIAQAEHPLNDSMISLPAGATVVKVYPNKVRIKLEQTEEAVLEIVPELIGELQEGLRIDKIEVVPPSVAVKGPRNRTKTKDRVRTTPIDVSAFSQSSEVEADLILPHPELRLASSPSRVKVRIIISVIESPPDDRQPDES